MYNEGMINNENANSRPDTRGMTGKIGEAFAAEYLKTQGYKILQTNIRFWKFGEIDIVAQEKKVIVFVEVKTRRSELFGTPQESVNFRKQKKLCQCAHVYLKKNNETHSEYRFDVVAILLDKDNKVKRVEVIKNAF